MSRRVDAALATPFLVVGVAVWAAGAAVFEPAVRELYLDPAGGWESDQVQAQAWLWSKDVRWAAMILAIGGLVLRTRRRQGQLERVAATAALWVIGDILLDLSNVHGWPEAAGAGMSIVDPTCACSCAVGIRQSPLIDLSDRHDVLMNLSTLRRLRFVAALLAAATVAGLTLVATTTESASAAPDTPILSRMLRICDQTGCYVAWAVRDSDGDGVGDADEIMAGTDPFDPRKRPVLTVVVELGLKRQLPTFEAGRGAFVAFPAQIVAAIAKGSSDPLGAFPLNGRKDAMSRAGISADQIAKAGIDLTKDGLTLGLGGISAGSPPLKIGGIDASLISAGSPSSKTGIGLEHGGVKSVTHTAGGTGTITSYNDGATKTVTPLKGGDSRDSRTTRTHPDGSDAGTATTRHQPTTKDGDVQVDKSNTTIYNPDDSLSAHVSVSVRTSPDGTVITTKDIIIYDRDDEGNITGITKATEVTSAYPDGYLSVGVAVDKCDAGGENCKTVSDVYTNNRPKEYLNPDADDTTIVTFDVVEQKLKLRGAAITVLLGWTAPGFEEDPDDPNDPTIIALVDEEVGRPYLLVEPLRITKAQPEVRGDLPNPYQDGGGCWPKCS